LGGLGRGRGRGAGGLGFGGLKGGLGALGGGLALKKPQQDPEPQKV